MKLRRIYDTTKKNIIARLCRGMGQEKKGVIQHHLYYCQLACGSSKTIFYAVAVLGRLPPGQSFDFQIHVTCIMPGGSPSTVMPYRCRLPPTHRANRLFGLLLPRTIPVYAKCVTGQGDPAVIRAVFFELHNPDIWMQEAFSADIVDHQLLARQFFSYYTSCFFLRQKHTRTL